MKNNNKNIAVTGKKTTDRELSHSQLIKWLLAVGFIVSMSVLYHPRTFQADTYNYKAGELCRKEIRAPRTITLQKDEETWKKEKKAAESRVPIYLIYRTEVVTSHVNYMDSFFSYVDSLGALIESGGDSVSVPDADFSRWNFGISDANLRIFLVSPEKRRLLEEFIRSTVDEFYQIGILEDNDEILKNSGDRKLILERDGEEHEVNFFQLFRASNYLNKVVNNVEKELGADADAVRVAEHILARVLTPNIFVDKTRTKRETEREILKLSRDWVTYLADEKIIGAYEQVTAEQAKILQALREELSSEDTLTGNVWGILAEFLAKVTFLVVILVLFSWYLYRFKPALFKDNSKLLLLLLLLIITTYISAYIIYNENLNDYMIPVTVASILCVLLVDAQLAVNFSLFVSLICSSFTSFDPSLLLVSLIVTVTASLVFRTGSNRLVYLKMASYTAAAYIISITFTGIIAQVDWLLTAKRIGFGVASAFASTFFAISVLPLFEKGFRITTPLTLYELADFNRPILRRLSLEAPGTYHHSVVVGNLAEAAATAIGANPLLARVGAYYHDIGKLVRPEYFIENQFSRDNKHDALNPGMSSLVIISHVKEGVKLGRQIGLPEVIIDFIRMHHGTTVLAYFYNKAVESDAHKSVSDEEYRYPGPKPRTKETAIVMLADTVEAMTYSLREATQGKLRSLIRNAVKLKVDDDQLSECNLTFADLEKIKESFLPVLKGIMQKRIDYPQQKSARKKTGVAENAEKEKKNGNTERNGNGEIPGQSGDTRKI